jgi:hypothetical protein
MSHRNEARTEHLAVPSAPCVRVVSLNDLIIIKLLYGLDNLGRSKHVADVVELIRRVPLDERFAARVPSELRATFEKLVDAVRADESGRASGPRF